MTGTSHWRPFGRREEMIRWFVPDISWTLPLANDLKLVASTKKHLGLFRRRARQREAAMASLLASYVRPDGVIYDIGANIGLYTVVFAGNRTRKVISFEPSDTAYPYLQRNIAANALTNVDAHQIVLSDRAGTCRFTLDTITTATSHCSEVDEPGVELPCADLDSYIAKHRLLPPDLIKMDVEGHDQAVLRGMVTCLSRDRPAVFVEGGLRAANGEIGAITFLQTVGYTVWDVNRRRQLKADTSEYSFLALAQ